MHPALSVILSVLTGYILGSLSPAYLFGKILKGIDIRTAGYKNAGTRNVKSELGLLPAAITAIIDTGKGVTAVVLSLYVYRLPIAFVFLPCFAAVTGHIFPFYLGFRGGKGYAVAVGLYLFFILREIAAGDFSPLTFGMILLVALILCIASRSGEATGIVAFSFMLAITPIELGISSISLSCTALSLFLLISITLTAAKNGLFHFPERYDFKLWRVISRPFALLFIPIDLIWNRTVLLILIGALALLFGAVDLVRLLSKVRLSLFFRKREAKRFSSMTKFLVSIFITFLVFRGEIPYLALAFITIGDLFSKVIGVKFGKIKLFKSRSLAGTLAFTGGCLMVGYILYSLLPMPLLFVLIGSPFAALVELFSESFDDNFTVGLISGGFLTAIRFFFPV